MPSTIHETGENKKRIIYEYRQRLKSIPCKYYRMGRKSCPFADRCFYLHGHIQRSASRRSSGVPPPNNNVSNSSHAIAYVWTEEKEGNSHRRVSSRHSPERIATLARAIQYARAMQRGNEAQYAEYQEDYQRVQRIPELNLELLAIVAKERNGTVEDPSQREEKSEYEEERVLDVVVHHDCANVVSDSESEYCYETGWD